MAWRWPTATTSGSCRWKNCTRMTRMRTATMSEWTFDRDAIAAFRFVRCDFDAASGVARLVYAFDDGPELTETITIPGAPFQLDEVRLAAAGKALRLLHLIAGVSYYKA